MNTSEIRIGDNYISTNNLNLNLRIPKQEIKIKTIPVMIPKWYIITPVNICGNVCRTVEFWLRLQWEVQESMYSYPIGLFAHYFNPYKE